MASACDSGSERAEPFDPANPPVITTASPYEGFELVGSFGELRHEYWVPVAFEGELLEPDLLTYWHLTGAEGAVSLLGTNGCNRFDSVDDSGRSTELVDGTLVELSISETLRPCPDDFVSIQPIEMDRFFVSDDGATLLVEHDSRVRVKLDGSDEPPPRFRDDPEEAEESDAGQAAEDQAFKDELQLEQDNIVEATAADLAVARQQWAAAGIDDYDLVFLSGCQQCPSFPVRSGPRDPDNPEIVTVTDGVGAGEWADASVGATVTAWFDYLDASIDAGRFVEASFDPDLGYPVDVYVGTGPFDALFGTHDPELDAFVLQEVRVIPR